jgi:general secretion pathway protein N
MRRGLLILISLVAFVAIVVTIAPASLAGVALERISEGRVALAEAEGTLWRGRGTLTAARVARVPVAWSIEPWPLLRGELRLQLSPPVAIGNSPRAQIVAHGDTVSMRDVDVTLPARLVEGLAPRSGIRMIGDVRITTPSLDWTSVAFLGGARLDWQDAQFAISVDPAIRLGTVNAVLAAAGDRLGGPITNDGGTFDVRGTGSIATNGAPGLSLVMTPRAGGDAAQARTLTIAAAPDGRWNVEFRMGPP